VREGPPRPRRDARDVREPSVRPLPLFLTYSILRLGKRRVIAAFRVPMRELKPTRKWRSLIALKSRELSPFLWITHSVTGDNCLPIHVYMCTRGPDSPPCLRLQLTNPLSFLVVRYSSPSLSPTKAVASPLSIPSIPVIPPPTTATTKYI
jgi:hypothetical protein